MTDRLDNDTRRFWQLMFEIVADVEKRISTHISLHGLTPPQFYVLKTLAEHDGICRIGEIATEHHLTNATMSGIINRLEAMQPPLVQRARSATDGRAIDVSLTDAGRERYWAVWNSLLQLARAVLNILPESERSEAIEKVELYFTLLKNQFPADQPLDTDITEHPAQN